VLGLRARELLGLRGGGGGGGRRSGRNRGAVGSGREAATAHAGGEDGNRVVRW
jgi:hypothetical protein